MTRPGYRLCWCSCLALVLLRVAIGGHVFFEGLWKIESWREGTKRFSAAGYLNNSSGPFRGRFRSQLDDPDGLERLEPASLVARWERTLNELDARYGLTEEQMTSARAKIRDLELAKEAHFADQEKRSKITGYIDDMEKAARDEESELSFERERAREKRRELERTRDDLLAPIHTWDKSLRDHVIAGLTAEQHERDSAEPFAGIAELLDLPFRLEWPERRIDQIDIVTMCGLTLSGGLLIIGLLSRLSALAAALLIAMFYLCNPAPPLGSGMPGDPGHYFYVNKELVECLAALVLATIPTGRWLGVDALIRGLITRRLSRVFFGPPDDAIVRS